MIKILINTILIMAGIFGALYFVKAQQLEKAKNAQIEARHQNNSISDEQYARLKEMNKLVQILLRPREVLNPD